ncbi:hypothetical protein Esti_001585 [Eimeria stiedai]
MPCGLTDLNSFLCDSPARSCPHSLLLVCRVEPCPPSAAAAGAVTAAAAAVTCSLATAADEHADCSVLSDQLTLCLHFHGSSSSSYAAETAGNTEPHRCAAFPPTLAGKKLQPPGSGGRAHSAAAAGAAARAVTAGASFVFSSTLGAAAGSSSSAANLRSITSSSRTRRAPVETTAAAAAAGVNMSSSDSSGGEGVGGASSEHGVGGGECLVCFEDITPQLYCDVSSPSLLLATSEVSLQLLSRPLSPSLFLPLSLCLRPLSLSFSSSHFYRYCESVSKSTCAREQQALLRRGPPINLSDAHAFPICGAEEVEALWVAAKDKEVSSKLEGSLALCARASQTGEARQKLWDDLRAFLIENEPLEESKEEVAS